MTDQPELPDPPAWSSSPTPGRTPASGAHPAGALLVLCGGVLVVIGTLLPWITASSVSGSVSVSGVKAGGWGFLILGGFAAARGLSIRWPEVVTLRLGTPLVGGVLLAGLLVLRWGEIQNALNDARTLPGVTASLGIGLLFVVVGIVAILVGGLMASRSR
jgi:hypothetical protein